MLSVTTQGTFASQTHSSKQGSKVIHTKIASQFVFIEELPHKENK